MTSFLLMRALSPDRGAQSLSIRLFLLTLVALFLSSCDVPRDPELTEQQVRESGVVRLGWVEGTPADPAALAALTRILQATDATAQRVTGDSERLLGELKNGKIDLVYGRFAQQSPWAKEVHFGRALGWRAKPPKHEEVPRFAFRQGENGWIMLVERASER